MKPIKDNDIIGKTYGNLKILKVLKERKGGKKIVECLCSCGKTKSIILANIRNGKSISCGCERIKSIAKHFMTNSKEYNAWFAMKQRCDYPNSILYHRYGGRGISYQEDWDRFENFFSDMGLAPSKNHSLDRIDNNGNYTKENCRWATREQQDYNKSTNVFITAFGKTMTKFQWVKETGLSYSCIHHRIKRGMEIEKALSLPNKRKLQK